MHEQKLTLFFNQPFYGDMLIWKDEKKKSKGYTLRNGKKSYKFSLNRVVSKKPSESIARVTKFTSLPWNNRLHRGKAVLLFRRCSQVTQAFVETFKMVF